MQVTWMRQFGVWLLGLVVAAALLAAGSAQAALMITVTASGSVTQGDDDGTLTGIPGSLLNQSVTVSHTFEFSGTTTVDSVSDPATAIFVELVTIAVQVGGGPQLVFDSSSAGFVSGFGVYSVGSGGLDSQTGVQLSGLVFSSIFSDALLANNLSQSFNVALTGNESFGASFNDGTDNLWFFLVDRDDVAAINVQVTGAVPEPGSMVLASLSLACVIVVRRRKSRVPC